MTTDDEKKAADTKTDDKATDEKKADEKTVPQSEVNRLVGEARREGRSALLSKAGVSTEEELLSAITEAQELKKSQMSELEAAKAEAERYKADAEKAAGLVKEAETKALRARIGRDKGLPEPLIELLVGDDEETITAKADELVPLVKEPPKDVGGGTNPAKTEGLSPNEQMADVLHKAITGRPMGG